jgi:hypothetical protein
VRPLCLAANAAWLASSLPASLAFHRDLHRVGEVQEELLLRILRRNANTAFGLAHGFASIRSLREYQQRVPVRTYDEYPELRGDAGALTSSPVTHYETTSGSSGAAKRIPFTRDLRTELGRAIAPWVVDLFAEHPGAFAGEAYWSVSPVLAEESGFAADEDYLGPLRSNLVRAVQAVPRDVRFIPDVDAFRRATLDHLLRCPTLSLISVWHPSFLLLLMQGIEDTERLWPKLRVISCWSDANAARDAARVAELFPHAHVQPKGLLSTEGVVSIPSRGAAAPALAYRSHLIELRDTRDGRVIGASEAEVGARYQVILTTGGGLYRYDTEDLVEIAGFRDACPLLRFVGRARHVADHYGEKLHELFVRERLDVVLGDLPVTFAMLACEGHAYALFIESRADDSALITAASALDETLRENVHYDYCRRLGQLQPLRVFRISRDGSTTVLRHSRQRLGDVKPAALDARDGWGSRFEGTWIVQP